MALMFPFENQTETPGFVRFSPCDPKGNPIGGGEKIELYLPPGIQFSDGANYEGFELGVSGALGADALASGREDGTFGGASASATSQIEQMTKGSNLGTAVLAQMAKAPLTPTQAIQGGLRAAVNPNTRVLFKSVALRTFQFTFKMIPTSVSEAQEIDAIVKSFRSQMYPELAGGAESGVSIGYLYPDMYLIEMFYGPSGSKKQIDPKIKASFLTAVSTTANSASGSILAEQGSSQHWNEVDITLTFGEGVTLSKADIVGGF